MSSATQRHFKQTGLKPILAPSQHNSTPAPARFSSAAIRTIIHHLSSTLVHQHHLFRQLLEAVHPALLADMHPFVRDLYKRFLVVNIQHNLTSSIEHPAANSPSTALTT